MQNNPYYLKGKTWTSAKTEIINSFFQLTIYHTENIKEILTRGQHALRTI